MLYAIKSLQWCEVQRCDPAERRKPQASPRAQRSGEAVTLQVSSCDKNTTWNYDQKAKSDVLVMPRPPPGRTPAPRRPNRMGGCGGHL